jgi:hypothetical protein
MERKGSILGSKKYRWCVPPLLLLRARLARCSSSCVASLHAPATPLCPPTHTRRQAQGLDHLDAQAASGGTTHRGSGHDAALSAATGIEVVQFRQRLAQAVDTTGVCMRGVP